MLTGVSRAQEELPTLSADRPGYTWGADVLAYHKLSWEHGFNYESSYDGSMTMTLNSMIVRYGIFENMELRVGTDFLMWNDGMAPEPSFGVAPLTLGTKIKVYESSTWMPSIAVLAQVQSARLGSSDLLSSHLAPSMYACFEHSIADRFSLSYNAGLEWNGEDATPTTFLSLAFWVGITEDLGAYLETINYLNADEGNQYLSELGVSWMVSRRLQLDLECDFDLQHFGKGYALGCGVAWMLN